MDNFYSNNYFIFQVAIILNTINFCYIYHYFFNGTNFRDREELSLLISEDVVEFAKFNGYNSILYNIYTLSLRS
jgi:hypothetical protein